MVNHYVFWNFKEDLSENEKEEAFMKMKASLEAVKEKVSGVVSLEVKKNELASSNRDVALLSTFESVEALNCYQVHPEHVLAGSFIKTVTCNRTCFDYEL